MPSRSVSEVAEHFAEYVARVADQGETLTVTREGEPIAELRPVKRGLRIKDLPAFFASLPHLEPAELEEFARDIEAGRAELSAMPQRDPWAS